MTITIRAATVADASALRVLAEATFREAFAEANSPEDMEQYVRETFTEAKQVAKLADPAHILLIAEHMDDAGGIARIGYAHLMLGSTVACVAGPALVELKRIYILRAWHGRHAAQALLDAVLRSARDHEAETLWLGVWEHNPRAIAFYRKQGFERVGAQSFKLGEDLQTDWVMVRSV